jgi:uncharacterized iron-regulated protein
MVNNIDRVIETSWLQKNNCNVFLIGEVHKSHQKCKPILEIFKSLIQQNSKLMLDIDVFVEIFQHDTVHVLDKHKVPKKDVQINHVRKYFNKCFTEHNCPMRIHWADPTQTNLENMDYRYFQTEKSRSPNKSIANMFKTNFIKQI